MAERQEQFSSLFRKRRKLSFGGGLVSRKYPTNQAISLHASKDSCWLSTVQTTWRNIIVQWEKKVKNLLTHANFGQNNMGGWYTLMVSPSRYTLSLYWCNSLFPHVSICFPISHFESPLKISLCSSGAMVCASRNTISATRRFDWEGAKMVLRGPTQFWDCWK